MFNSFKSYFLDKEAKTILLETSENVNHFWARFFKKKKITQRRAPVLRQASTLCTMGSCFANELRNAFTEAGFRILPLLESGSYNLFSNSSYEIPDWGKWDERVHYQWYNPASLLLEARIAFSLDNLPDRSVFPCKKNGQNVYQDPYRRLVFADSEAKLIELRTEMDHGIRTAFEDAEAFVFTLGLTEAWWDKSNKLALCADPDYGNPDSKSSCFFQNMNFADCYNAMESLITLINDKRGSSIPIFLSVSPIPLARTFRNVDVVIANSNSKSILRTVAAEICEKYQNVIYFPSYEICMNDQDSFCKTDGRHVNSYKVQSIIKFFRDSYLIN
jgi:hypothetical protein